MERNGKQFYTKNKQLIDISTWDISSSPSINELENKYGWEGAMAYGNLINDELNQHGPGIQPGDVYLDLGANVGMSALRAELSGASKLYCIEPDPGVYEALEMNKSDKWENFNLAISDYDGEINIPKWPNWWEEVSRPCITLENFFYSNKISHIDYMKVDIEGHEIKIMPQISKAIYDKIDKIFVEYHENTEIEDDERNKNRIKFIKSIESRGYNNHFVHLGWSQSFMYFWK